MSPTSFALFDGRRILRESLSESLRQLGHRPTLATGDGQELLAGISRERPNALLAGLKYPADPSTPQAWQVLRFARQWHPDVRIVMLGDTAETDEVVRAQQLGAAAYLHKDTVGPQEVAEVLERVTHGETVFPMTPGFFSPRPHAQEETPEPLRQLTHRELQVLRHVAAGSDNLKIAAQMDISERTVRSHVSNLYKKLGSENRAQLALLARELGVRPVE